MITVFNPASTQRGAVLIVALVMLLLLTIIGLTGMRGTALQENMASNLRESNISLQAAEAALRAGEEEASRMFIFPSEGDTLVGSDLDNKINGSYTGLTGTAQTPTYSIVKLASLRTSLEVGVPEVDEGILVRIDAVGAGFSLDNNNQPSTQSRLRSTYLVE